MQASVNFDRYFQAASYAMIACGALALTLAGGMSAGWAAIFAVVLGVCWNLEGTRWQLSERAGLIVVLLALPLFYFDWKFQTSAVRLLEQEAHRSVSALVHLTLFLSSVKLLQVKADRDWLFLYLISFFEVLLAAGLSISPLFLAALSLYLFFGLLTVVCFELRKARRALPHSESRLLVEHQADRARRQQQRGSGGRERQPRSREFRRLPAVALCLLVLIFVFALPIFFFTPRANNSALAMAGGSAATGYTGFSDQMTLGDIGNLQKSERLVMRVRVEDPLAMRNQNLRWRGVALDYFDGRRWQRSSNESQMMVASGNDFFQLGTTENLNRLTKQTFFVEPIDTPVLFVAPRAVALQGALPFVRKDAGDGLVSRLHMQERITYRAYSDTLEPSSQLLRADTRPYPRGETANLRLNIRNYLALPPNLDTRISSLAWLIIDQAGARNRYDAARAIEAHLSRNAYDGAYGYSLQMRAGGRDPLSDFLFNVREAHCEYFATAMAVMLRTQGIASRVVNGFQAGEYNETADAYIVRQQDAHSWVEVYFPETDSWVTFDPTPAAGRPSSANMTGLRAQLQRYTEALEMFWIQYVVAYDKQGQRTLALSMRGTLGSYQQSMTQSADELKSWLASLWSGSENSGASETSARNVAGFVGLAAFGGLAVFALLYLKKLGRRRTGKTSSEQPSSISVVRFYERMMKALEARGVSRASNQTPLEFALVVGTPEALKITQAYHRVRYGAQNLSSTEVEEIEMCLRHMEEEEKEVVSEKR